MNNQTLLRRDKKQQKLKIINTNTAKSLFAVFIFESITCVCINNSKYQKSHRQAYKNNRHPPQIKNTAYCYASPIGNNIPPIILASRLVSYFLFSWSERVLYPAIRFAPRPESIIIDITISTIPISPVIAKATMSLTSIGTSPLLSSINYNQRYVNIQRFTFFLISLLHFTAFRYLRA